MRHSLLNDEQNLVAASLLAANAGDLTNQALSIRTAGADWLHIDTMDGCFVPPITFGATTVAALRTHLDCVFDVHLMVSAPDKHLEAFAEAGADIITVHIEASPHVYRTLQTIKKLGKYCGIALNPGTPIEHIYPVLDLVDLVLVMTVNPGWGGQAFLEDQCAKIEALQQQNARQSKPFIISVDGGIDARTSGLAVGAGAHVVAAGSACFTGSPAQYSRNVQALHHPLV